MHEYYNCINVHCMLHFTAVDFEGELISVVG